MEISGTIQANQDEEEIARCLGVVRLVPKSMLQAADYKLQQAWEIIQYRAGQPWKRREEWRDVPIENYPQ